MSRKFGCNKVFTVQVQCVLQCAFRKLSAAASVPPKPFSSIPGLKSFPIIGPLHNFLPFIGEIGPKGNIFDLLDTLRVKYGPIVKMNGAFARGPMVVLFEPEDYEQVYRAEDLTSLRPGFAVLTYYREQQKSTFEGMNGTITAQGKEWRDFRMKVNPALLKPKLVKLYGPALDEIAVEMTQRLSRIKNDEEYLKWNFDTEMTKFSLESIALVALGTRLGCLQDSIPADHPAKKMMDSTKVIFEMSYKLEILPSPWRYISTPSYKKITNAYDSHWKISTNYIKHAQKALQERGHDIPDEDKSVIEKLLAIDEKVAVVMANEMLFAGIDTVAFVTTNLLYHLAINPKVQDKLRAEIRSDPESGSKYFRACLKEALRFYHVVPANLRRTSKPHVVRGYEIPEGVDVIAPNEYLSRMEKYYPRPNEFIPERWIADKSDPLYYGNAHPMVTLPFGFGLRSCLGRRIAQLEMEIFVTRFINELKVSWDGPPLKVVNKLTNTIKKPYYFKFEDAK
ncbi:cytochrome P450 CYP12A2 [Manduca sexta]|uniref:Cytochrome P450 n=1 Tax=Manduca sexta TaxID=7130 RepID=A0A921YSA5_MANSE|nr:cytochrome P450 CYP12A2 [Manduca sexta]KAG6443747.1 hypothetical protein O3G_MSEX002986 [Manduca sexta]